MADDITEAAATQLKQGILLNNEKHPTLPAKVEVINNKLIYLSIQEGKYHQVKRMLAAVGNHVTQLHRYQIGNITLDQQLAIGQYRALTTAEVSYFTP